jgi:hypothetical protein
MDAFLAGGWQKTDFVPCLTERYLPYRQVVNGSNEELVGGGGGRGK